jgi:hypothetical protein
MPGTYRFLDNDTVTCANSAGQVLTWKRYKASAGPMASASPTRPGNSTTNLQPAPEAASARAPAYDPSLPPATNAAIAAFNRKDYQSPSGVIALAAVQLKRLRRPPARTAAGAHLRSTGAWRDRSAESVIL